MIIDQPCGPHFACTFHLRKFCERQLVFARSQLEMVRAGKSRSLWEIVTVRHIAIIGSGPAGYYTAEAAQKLWGEDVQVDIFDMLPVPYGLIRTGVAPDHQSIKAVYRRYETTSLSGNVRFVGNVMIGNDISVAELQELYDAVVLATGAPHDKPVGMPATRPVGA